MLSRSGPGWQSGRSLPQAVRWGGMKLQQEDLFGTDQLRPEGLAYRAGFLAADVFGMEDQL